MANFAANGASLDEKTVEELLRMADEFSTMADIAVTPSGKQALERLATRFRIFAARSATARQRNAELVRPGAPAPSAGLYELRNVFGTWVGDVARMQQGELLPRAPHEFTWHLTV